MDFTTSVCSVARDRISHAQQLFVQMLTINDSRFCQITLKVVEPQLLAPGKGRLEALC